MNRLLDQVLHIRPHERRTVWLLFAYAFHSAAAYVVTRAVADGIFLTRLGPEFLPQAYLLSAAVVIALSVGYSWLVRHARLDRVIRRSILLLALASAVLPTWLRWWPDARALLLALYVLAEVRGGIGTVQLGTLLNELLPQDPGRRVFGLIGAGATLAGIVFGGVVGWEARHVGALQLLYLAAALDLLSLLPLRSLRPDLRRLWETALRKTATRSGPPNLAGQATLVRAVGNRFVQAIALLVFLKVLVSFLVEFQWKLAAADYFEASSAPEEALTSFFGGYYAALYLFTGLFQLLVTGRLLKRFDILIPLLVLPASLTLATLGVLGTSTTTTLALGPITVAKFCETFKRSLHDPALQLLFSPLPVGPRRQAIALVNGIVKPGAEAFAGLLILEFAWAVPIHWLSYGVLVLLVGWFAAAHACRKALDRQSQPRLTPETRPGTR